MQETSQRPHELVTITTLSNRATWIKDGLVICGLEPRVDLPDFP